jgi:hypothetical protein
MKKSLELKKYEKNIEDINKQLKIIEKTKKHAIKYSYYFLKHIKSEYLKKVKDTTRK